MKYIRLRFGVLGCDGVCWDAALGRRDGVIGLRFCDCESLSSFRDRFDGVLPFLFGVDIFSAFAQNQMCT